MSFTTVAKKEEGRSRTKTKPKTETPAPPTLDLTDELHAWVRDTGLQVDVSIEWQKFRQYCTTHPVETPDFKYWLLEAHRRATRNGHRPGIGPDPVAAALRTHQSSARPVNPSPDSRPTPTLAADAAPPAWAYVQGIYGLHLDCGTYHQRSGPCPPPPGRAREEPLATPHPLGSDTGPPPEATERWPQVVRAAEEHGFIGLGELVAAVAPNGNGHHHASEAPP